MSLACCSRKLHSSPPTASWDPRPRRMCVRALLAYTHEFHYDYPLYYLLISFLIHDLDLVHYTNSCFSPLLLLRIYILYMNGIVMVINFSLILYLLMCMQLLLNHSTSNGMVEVEGSTKHQVNAPSDHK